MPRSLYILTCALLICSGMWAQNAPDDWGGIKTNDPAERNMIIFARELYKNHRIYEAISFLKKTIKQHPGFYDAHFYLGFFYQEIQNHQKAVQHFSQAIRIKNNYKEPYFLRGNSFVALGLYRPALDDYVKTIRLDPSFYGAYNNIACIKLMNQGNSGTVHIRDVEMARQEISKILDEIELNDKSVFFNLGIIYMRLGMHHKAIELLSHAVLLDPECSKCCYYLALAYFYERQYVKARQYFTYSWKYGYNVKRVEEFIEYLAKVENYLKAQSQ
jgi:tetratricopeptide (TPR) repeat protein